jgi:putative N6-adenine-specific DNA methylase
MQEFTAIALCAVGAEKVVSNELRKLKSPPPGSGGGTSAAYTILESGFGKVRFKTDLAGLYRSLMSLRAADRVLLEAGTFPAGDFDALFDGAGRVAWENFIPRGMGVHVTKVRSARSRLKAETSIQAMVHKAVAERLCGRYGMRRLPEDGKQAELRVYIEKDEASLLLDLSGDPLFKRGYRRGGGTAPLRETTAAAIILLSGWRRKFPLYDPLCGSGTIVIEAAMYAWDMAPGIGRGFALSGLAIGDRHCEDAVRQELAEAVNFDRVIRIAGSDADKQAVALAKTNIVQAGNLARRGRTEGGLNAGLGNSMPIQCRPMKDAKAALVSAGSGSEQDGDTGFIITNPPYGRRLGNAESAEAGYSEMACLRENFPGWKMALICDHPGFETHFGKKANSCRELKSGAVEAYLYEYEKL